MSVKDLAFNPPPECERPGCCDLSCVWDRREAEQGRDEGMRQAEDHADPRVILAIDAAIDRANASGEPWSANTIRDQLPTVTSKGLVGARVRAAAMRRPAEMEPTGRYPKSNLPSTRSARVTEWRGVGERRVAS
jgi:hypothetical protein